MIVFLFLLIFLNASVSLGSNNSDFEDKIFLPPRYTKISVSMPSKTEEELKSYLEKTIKTPEDEVKRQKEIDFLMSRLKEHYEESNQLLSVTSSVFMSPILIKEIKEMRKKLQENDEECLKETYLKKSIPTLNELLLNTKPTFPLLNEEKNDEWLWEKKKEEEENQKPKSIVEIIDEMSKDVKLNEDDNSPVGQRPAFEYTLFGYRELNEEKSTIKETIDANE